MIFDDTNCTLGEGPLWHPERGELFWFDIFGKRLHWQGGSQEFDDYVSAAGWVDRDTLIMASANALWRYDIGSRTREKLADLEADKPANRSNDGRADPYGGFWIGTMGVKAEPGVGAIYRYYKGELRTLFPDISISNAICFPPDGTHGYFTDTPTKKIMRVALDKDGWPKGDAEVWLDLSDTPYSPDGAVFDAGGNFWNAQWGANRVACYDAKGNFVEAIGFAATQTSCPAFGGAELTTLYCTTAAEGLEASRNPHQGKTFACDTRVTGQAEHRVLL